MTETARRARSAVLWLTAGALCGCSSKAATAVDAQPGAADGAAPGADARATDAGRAADAGPPADAGPAGLDLCDGLVKDKQPRPMTALAKPAVGEVAIDAELGTRIRRITQVPATGANPAIRPLYSTVSAWNADESRLILYRVGVGHQLYDGKTYQLIRTLDDLDPPDIEQVYWHTSDPDVLLLVEGKDLIRYHVGARTKDKLATFDFCTVGAGAGSDPMFTSWDSNRIGLGCGGQKFIYDIEAGQVLGRKTLAENPPQVAPSGTLAWLGDSGRVVDLQLNVVRTLDMANPSEHSSLGRLPTGEDTWDGVVFDQGPRGNDDIGSLVVWDLGRGASRVIIGPKTGWPYPPTTHVSTLSYRRPGWAFVSTLGDLSGKGLLDLEITIANTADGTVCRAGRHRSWGKQNTHLADSYWAEAHAVPSPSGTRAVFASDWGNGATVDAYVVELPGYPALR